MQVTLAAPGAASEIRMTIERVVARQSIATASIAAAHADRFDHPTPTHAPPISLSARRINLARI